MMRIEKDFRGEVPVPEEALYGIHALRGRMNFPEETRFHPEWYQAVGVVKQACYQTIMNFIRAIRQKFEDDPEKTTQVIQRLGLSNERIYPFLEKAAAEVAVGSHFDAFLIPACSGGAGTSINMNVNEIIANVALKMMGLSPGEYSAIDPVEHANQYQSTNDVIPTALRVAIMKLLQKLENGINDLRLVTELQEKRVLNIMRPGYTQMQEAVPTSFGKLFSTYNEALSRDWWRISRCFERLKQVNLGGSAVGTGLAVPRFFIMEVVSKLQNITNLPVTRSENLPDATSNLDSLVEVHAILKAHAVNLEKMSGDLRLLASDIGPREVILPAVQVGSSIMPGKVNPVIPEFVISAAHKVYANDQLVGSLAAQGCLELNAYLPVIGHAILDSLKLLISADQTLRENLMTGLEFQVDEPSRRFFGTPSLTTILVPVIGYNQASEIARFMKEHRTDIFEANRATGFLSEERLRSLIHPGNLLKLGFTLSDLE